MVVGQVGGAGLAVAVPVGVHDLGVQWAASDVGSGDVVLLLGQQILEEGGTCTQRFINKSAHFSMSAFGHLPARMRARKEMARAFSEMNLMMVNMTLTTTAFFSFKINNRGSSIFFMRLLRDSVKVERNRKPFLV